MARRWSSDQHQHDAVDDEVVEGLDGAEQLLADAGIAEHDLHQDRARQHVAEREREQRDLRQDRVAQRRIAGSAAGWSARAPRRRSCSPRLARSPSCRASTSAQTPIEAIRIEQAGRIEWVRISTTKAKLSAGMVRMPMPPPQRQPLQHDREDVDQREADQVERDRREDHEQRHEVAEHARRLRARRSARPAACRARRRAGWWSAAGRSSRAARGEHGRRTRVG